jgi:enhancing lycopene biosynthesis protein 2
MASLKRVGVVLSGCGYLDGAEIHEVCCTLLSLDRRGAKLVALAPDVEQMHVVDHLKGAPVEGQRRRS